jgi:two-component system, sensor histidine kinase and response regulator
MVTPTSSRLLILDDEAMHMRALCDTLEAEGYTTTGFTEPTQALAALREQSFDLVLTDLTMPGMDGIEFLQAAREIDVNMVGIVMTGHGTIDSAVAAMKAGALDYILKPFTLRMIVPVLTRALTVRSLRTENVQLRQAEETIRRMNANLERCVQERTRELIEANRELEAFSHSVSHDLRAPLRALDGFTSILADQYSDRLDERGRGYVQRVVDAVDRMRNLIEDLLRLSHVTGTELNRRDLDLSQLVHSIVDELRAQDPERQVTVEIAAGVKCNGDHRLLRIALENILGNAWKFTRNTPNASIEFGVEQLKEGTTYFIRDNGAGFNPDYGDRLFIPFRRLHSAAEFPGTGIGLSIVQRIVRRHGGRISAHGAVGKGAAFHFSLGTPLTEQLEFGARLLGSDSAGYEQLHN